MPLSQAMRTSFKRPCSQAFKKAFKCTGEAFLDAFGDAVAVLADTVAGLVVVDDGVLQTSL